MIHPPAPFLFNFLPSKLGWHANVLGGVGSVGLMAAMWAKYRGAKQIVVIDGLADRLNLAQARLGVHTVDFNKVPVLKTVQELIPGQR